MGYPMTYRRVVSRNDLRGDYGAKVSLWNTAAFPSVPNDGTDLKGFELHQLAVEIDRLNQRWSLIQGDLRRMEQDAVDENAICKIVAQRTGLDPEIVAAVLKEFVSV